MTRAEFDKMFRQAIDNGYVAVMPQDAHHDDDAQITEAGHII